MAASRPRLSEHWPDDLPRVIAHRGYAREVPENTITAFRLAIEAGATDLESDVRATKDGVAVLWHDADLESAGISGVVIAETTLTVLQSIDIGGGERIPTLAQALDSLPAARFNIDIKSADAIWPAGDAIRSADARDRVLVASFSEYRRRQLVRQFPGIATSAAWFPAAGAIFAAKFGLQRLVNRLLRDVDAMQIPLRYGPLDLLTVRVHRAFVRAGVEVHLWTINDPDEIARLIELGVDGIISDRVDLVVAAHASR